jgi:hypothetical protein
MAVERREESEAVFARKWFRPRSTGIRDGDTPGLPTEPSALFVDGHVEPALDECLRSRQSGDATAEDGNVLTHWVPVSP